MFSNNNGNAFETDEGFQSSSLLLPRSTFGSVNRGNVCIMNYYDHHFVSKLELVLRDTWARFEKLYFSVLWWNISSQFLQTVVQYLKKTRYDYHSASSTVFANRRISIFNCVGDIAGSVVSQSESVWVLANRRNSRYDISRKRKSAFRWWAPSFVPQWQFNSSTVSRSFLSLFTLTDFNFKLDLSQRIY